MVKIRGITLVEIIIAVCITSLLVAIGTPNLNQLYQGYRAKMAIKTIQQHIISARNYAISYQTRVTVCPLDENNACTDDWINGFTIFTDNKNYSQLDPDEKVFIKSPPFHQQDFITYNNQVIKFLPTGLASGNAGTLTYCPDRFDSKYNQSIVINNSGRVRIEQKQTKLCKITE